MCVEMNRKMYVTFNDLDKAFDVLIGNHLQNYEGKRLRLERQKARIQALSETNYNNKR